jgi:LysM repeat protein
MPRIGDTVRPELMRADTSGILRGSAAGAAAMGQGLANLGASLGQAAQTIGANKNAVKDGKEMAKAMLQLHGAESEIGKVLTPVVDAFDSEELRFSEKLGLARRLTPLIGAATQKQAADIAEEARKVQKKQWRKGYRLEERGVKVQEDLAESAKMESRAKLLTAGGAMDPITSEFNKVMIKDISQFMAGGATNASENIGSLDEVIADLKSGVAKTGPWQGMLPDRIAQKRKSVEDKVSRIIFESLKDILGAQFTENEAKKLLAASFDRNSTEELNLERVKALKTKLERKYNQQMRFANQFKKRGFMTPNPGEGMTLEDSQAGFLGEGFPGAGAPGGGATSRLGGFRQRREGTARPAPGAQPAPGGSDVPGTHRVQGGSFSDIARQHGLTVEELKSLNPDHDGIVKEGELLRVEPYRVRGPRVQGTSPATPPAQDPGGDIITGPGGRSYEMISPAVGPRYPKLIPRAEVAPEDPVNVDDASRAVPVDETQNDLRASRFEVPGGKQVVELGGKRYLATPEDQGARLAFSELPPEPRRGRIPAEIKENVQVLDTHRNAPSSRQALKGVKHVVSLDFNDAKNKRAKGIEMVLPKNATAAQTQSAEKYVRLASQFFKDAGVKNPVRDGRGLPKGQNRPGIVYKFANERMMYTEPFFASHPEARKAIEKNPREYARLLLEAFGDLPGVTFLPPHTGSNKGATSGGVSEQAWAKKHILPYLQELTR